MPGLNATVRRMRLVSALSHLAKAVQLLQDADERDLRDRAFDLSNDVLKATQKPTEAISTKVNA